MDSRLEIFKSELERRMDAYWEKIPDAQDLLDGKDVPKEQIYALGAYNALESLLNLIESFQPGYMYYGFKVGDRIRIKGTSAKGDIIKNIYANEKGELMFEFENSDDRCINDCVWEKIN